MALHSTHSILYEIAIPILGLRWRVRNSQNCTMFTCLKRLSVHSWSKPVSGSPAKKHGKPLALYSYKASVFRINNKNATGGDGYAQFAHAMHELNIQTICTNISDLWNSPICLLIMEMTFRSGPFFSELFRPALQL